MKMPVKHPARAWRRRDAGQSPDRWRAGEGRRCWLTRPVFRFANEPRSFGWDRGRALSDSAGPGCYIGLREILALKQQLPRPAFDLIQSGRVTPLAELGISLGYKIEFALAEADERSFNSMKLCTMVRADRTENL
jgi:hypothetical protein